MRTHVSLTPASADPAEACPFCGRGPVAPAKRPARRISVTVSARVAHVAGLPARFRSDPNFRPAFSSEALERIPFGTLPAQWAYPESGTREHMPAELAIIASAEHVVAEHRGQVAIVDEASNSVTGWRDAA